MNVLFQAHSGVRYLVLLAAVAAIAAFAYFWSTGREYGRSSRIAARLFTGVLDLQVLLGIGVILTGTWYARLMGHVGMMVGAAIAAHALLVLGRKRAERDAKRAHALSLAGVVLALALIVGGIMAIGRGVFQNSIEPHETAQS
ncbi:MAG TPA: hypothetical protein VFQ45_03155 [Longimicrobium sp.]|nr:hypothetical protein [Longimicrobium sp.]